MTQSFPKFSALIQILLVGFCLWGNDFCFGADEAAHGSAATWWAFRPLTRPNPPTSGHPIDAWIGRGLLKKGLQPNGVATPRELVRRVYFDLIGLAPSESDIAAFEKDPSDRAWIQMVDRLLASPQYGERWGRHWLDVVRFAQSNGYERDSEKLFAWRYRDYVIRAFNEDKPYAQFVREQLAGDEWVRKEESEGRPPNDRSLQDALIATGFLRLGVLDDEPDDKLMAEYDELDDVVSATGAAFLGLTLGCARCHDHKFDPIPQKDYYSFLAFFRGLRTAGKMVPNLEASALVPLASPAKVEAWIASHAQVKTDLEKQLATATSNEARAALKRKVEALQQEAPPFEWTLGARNLDGEIPVVQVLSRGNPRTPGATVTPAFLSATTPLSMENAGGTAKLDPPNLQRGRRLALAEWIASPANPLTARVVVNRVWHQHFGKGLVRTTTDFGKAGVPPTHPELLDWLASEFLAQGGSIKRLHRLILTSETWKKSSRQQNEQANLTDPGNDLYWRQQLRRLDAEALRDSLLQASGDLNLQSGGRGFFPHLSGEVLAGGSRPGTDWQVSSRSEECRRTVYSYVRRTSMVPMLEAFDYSNVTSPLGERPVTTVAPQALMLLNDTFVKERARSLARRTARFSANGDLDLTIAIDAAWRKVLGRVPSEKEGSQVKAFFHRERDRVSQAGERWMFRPDVPDTLSTPFFNALPADHFLVGPDQGWSYFKGRWPKEYEGNKNMEAGRGPFALMSGVQFTNGVVECRWLPQIACDSCSLLLRTVADQGVDRGIEVVLDFRNRQVSVRKVEMEQAKVLASSPAELNPATPVQLKVNLQGSNVQLFVGDSGSPLLKTSVPEGNASGGLGVRAWGAGVGIDRWRVSQGGDSREWLSQLNSREVHLQAWEQVCLMLLNLNEVSYVD